MAVVERIGPCTAGQGEGAVPVCPSCGSHIGEAHRIVVRVRIADAQGAVGRQGPVLGHGAGEGAADHRIVFGTVDGDGDRLRAAVAGGERISVGEILSHVQFLNGRMAVVECIGPCAAGQGEGAVPVCPGRGSHIGEAHRIVVGVCIADAQGAIGG